jgi:hypothetical protein
LFLALAVPFPIFASGGIPQIELSVSKASPGATIEVNGGRFEPDAVVTLMMLQPERQIQLGTVIADDHGEFTSALLLPIDLPYGQYEFQAVDEHSRVARTVLTISRDMGEQEDSSQRGEDEPLLNPMPQNKAVSPSQRVEDAAPPVPAPAEDSSAWWLLPLGTVAVVGVGLALRRRAIRQ